MFRASFEPTKQPKNDLLNLVFFGAKEAILENRYQYYVFFLKEPLYYYVYYLCWAIVNTRGIIDEMIRSKETVHVTYLLTFNIYLCKYVSTSSWQVIFYTMKKLENLELVPTFSIFSLSFIHDNFMHYKKTCNSTFLWNDVGNIKKTLCVIHLRFFFCKDNFFGIY